MTLSVYLIDDEAHALDTLRHYVNDTPGLRLAGALTDAVEALHEINAKSPALVIADIDMPRLNGLALAKLIPPTCHLVFSTSFRNYGPEAFELAAVDYLLKPVSYARFLSCITKIRELHSSPKATLTDNWYVKTGNRGHWQRISFQDILYLQGAENYVSVQMTDNRIMTHLTMAEAALQLPAGQYVRVHRSYLVNWAHIRTIQPGKVGLGGDLWIPIGRAYRDIFFKELSARAPHSIRE